jgi:L-amino acid N-acyltransferase YncA
MNLSYEQFANIDLADGFFDSLKEDYQQFGAWFDRKAAEYAYVSRGENNRLEGFLYLKPEDGAVTDVTPVLPETRRLKVGTFKINAHGTRFGERFMKKIFDHALAADVSQVYVTVFPRHTGLMDLFARYGFRQTAVKTTADGEEAVLLRDFKTTTGNVVADYPFFRTAKHQYALLGIYPQWHTRLFPDSKLNNESPDIVKDISHTNSIHKVYLCAMKGVLSLMPGDIVLIYRTKAQGSSAPAHYTSVVTSVCVIEETRHLSSFMNLDEFLAYASPYSVFTEGELVGFWKTRRYPNIIRFTYNAAFKHRVTRSELLQTVGLPADEYYGFLPVTLDQLRHILLLGKANENLVID